jgi:hypothetical protein
MESTCDQLKSGEVFYDTDEGHIGCLPPLRVLCSPRRPRGLRARSPTASTAGG